MPIVFRTEGEAQPGKGESRSRPSLYSVVLVVTLCVFLLVVLGSLKGGGSLATIYQQLTYRRELAGKIAREEARKQGLLGRVEALKHDPLELERVAREELGLVKPSEIVFDFRRPEPRRR